MCKACYVIRRGVFVRSALSHTGSIPTGYCSYDSWASLPYWDHGVYYQ